MTRAIIFSGTKRNADQLANELSAQGHSAAALHGDMNQAMRDRVGDLLGLDTVAVSVKAKTNEKMDAIGAGEGLAAYAVVLLEELGE